MWKKSAQAAAGCLLGERNASNEIVYRPVTPLIEPDISSDGSLSLRFRNGSRIGETYKTGDFAERCGDGILIRSGSDRMNPKLLRQLASWSAADWLRRTGFVGKNDDGRYCFQLRAQVAEASKHEMQFYEFAAEYSFSWLNKPDWS